MIEQAIQQAMALPEFRHWVAVAAEKAAHPLLQAPGLNCDPSPILGQQAAPTMPQGMPSPDCPEFQADLAEARQHIKRGWRAKRLAEEYGWELEFCQELCAAEGMKA